MTSEKSRRIDYTVADDDDDDGDRVAAVGDAQLTWFQAEPSKQRSVSEDN